MTHYIVYVSDDDGQVALRADDKAMVISIVRQEANRSDNTFCFVEDANGTPIVEFIRPSENELRTWLKG